MFLCTGLQSEGISREIFVTPSCQSHANHGTHRPLTSRRPQGRQTVCSQGSKEHSSTSRQPASLERRGLLLLLAAAPLVNSQLLQAQELLGNQPSRRLPEGYEEFAEKLAAALREAIETDLSDAEERQVRKKADPAKNLVKGWLSQWKDAPGVQGETSYTQLSGTIKELGEFYRKKGQRARLPRSLGDELLAKVAAAENALPLPSSADGKQKI